MKVNDITENTVTVFDDLEEGDYFTVAESSYIAYQDTIWKKISKIGAVQITDDDSFSIIFQFAENRRINKIKIVSIDYRRIE